MTRISHAARALLAASLAVAIPRLASAQQPKGELFKSGFLSPIGLTAPTNDIHRVFVVERAGRIRVVKDILVNPVTNTQPFLDISSLTSILGERGLFSMAFDRQYSTTGRFYVCYANPVGSIVLARHTVSANPDVANPAGEILLTIPHAEDWSHYGGQLAFGPDGYLYMSTGDGGSGNDPWNHSQDVNVLLGKMLRLDVSTPTGYAIPPDNPFAASALGRPEIWARGLRNPWRFSFDRNTGDLYIADVGQEAREEIDFQSSTYAAIPDAPLNYGWRCWEGTLATNTLDCVYPNSYPGGDVKPIWEYAHAGGRCVIGGFVYRGAQLPDLRGHYFYADFIQSKIWSFLYTGTVVDNVQDRTTQLSPDGGLSISSITSFGQDAAGELYILDNLGGEIFRIVPATPNILGVTSYGSGSPGCSGRQELSVNVSPVINNPAFMVHATQCPPSSLGLCLITDLPDVVGSDSLSMGILIHVDLFLSTTLLALDMASDDAGLGTIVASIPNDPVLVGLHFFTQVFSAWTNCALPPFNLSSSNALDLTIQ